jgi:uncharacterized protein (TIGR00251 family)
MKRIRVRIHAGAKNTGLLTKTVDGVWKIHIAAPPVDGRANKELIRYLAKALDVPRSEIKILKGHTSKQKTVGIPDHISMHDIEI